jgi:hypothetical protein
MLKKLEIEQGIIQKELEIYNGWIYQTQILFGELLYKITMIWQKFKKISIYNKTTSLLIFNMWTL